jgi:hypothetical protein
MTKLTFNETTYEFKPRFFNGNYSLHIFVNDKLTKVIGGYDRLPIGPQSLQDCVELINEYDI